MSRRPARSQWIAALGAIAIVATALIVWNWIEGPERRTGPTDSSLAQHRVFSFSKAGDVEIDPQALRRSETERRGGRLDRDGEGEVSALARVASRRWFFPIVSARADR